LPAASVDQAAREGEWPLPPALEALAGEGWPFDVASPV
jgi:hypothetical protein